MNKRTKKILSIDEAIARARKYCAYRERSRTEVIQKLKEYGVPEGDTNMLVKKLINEGFLDEKRFAFAFTGGKFRMKKWGRNRIKMEMKKKGIPQELIAKGLSELSEKDYIETLDALLTKKWKQLQRKKEKQNFAKLVRYALQKGYEQEIVMERVKKIIQLITL